MPELPDFTASIKNALIPWLKSPMVVAYSGGVDSTVLLHCLVKMREQGVICGLKALHINHGLSDNADLWEAHCLQVCDRWQVPLQVAKVRVGDNRGEGLEQAARVARYDVFKTQLLPGECLLQGHHQNDQAETLLFRLFRGTGVSGMSGIPVSRALGKGVLVRPMLSVSRVTIEKYAQEQGLVHIEDESNQNQHFSRNYLRQSLLPAIEQRWPNASKRLALLASELALVNEQLDQVITDLAQAAFTTRPQWLLGDKPLLDLSRLEKMRANSQRQVVRYWLKCQQLPVPGRQMLSRVFSEVVSAKVDAEPLLCWAGCELRRYQGVLIASQPLVPVQPVSGIYWHWYDKPEWSSPDLGRLTVVASEENGACLPPLTSLEVRTRDAIDPGIKISIAGRSGRKTLKRWLQEYHVPPWVRGRIPFLFDGNQMVAAPGLWVCSDYLAAAGEGYELLWSAP